MFLQQFVSLTISRLELFIASLAWGYKVRNTIEPAKTEDCRSGRAFRPHEPIGCAKKHKQKEHQNKNKTNSTGLFCFLKESKENYAASKLIGTKLNTIKKEADIDWCCLLFCDYPLCGVLYSMHYNTNHK